MTDPTPGRVLIVDDHPVVRDGLAGMLAGQPDMDVVAQAANGREALLLVQRHDPDVVLMDLRMPEMDGVAAITAMREKGATAPPRSSRRWSAGCCTSTDDLGRSHGATDG